MNIIAHAFILIGLVLLLPGTAVADTRMPPRDLMLVLDNSGSMRKNDPDFLLRDAVRTFVDGLEGDVRLGVVIFDARSTLAVPLSALEEQSRRRILESLAAVDYRGRFTDIPGAIERAIYELKRNGRPDARRSIVFITDGIVDTGDAQRDRERKAWLERELVADAADEGIRIFAIAFTENADFQLIQTLAEKSDGDYFRAPTAADLPQVFARIDEVLAPEIPEPTPEPPPAPAVPAPAAPTAPSPVTEPPAAPVTAPEAPEHTARPATPAPLPAPASPTPALSQDPRFRIFAGAVLILLLLILLLLSRRRTRGGGTGAEALPEAWLMELGKSGEPVRHRLSHRATMLGRVAGRETPDLGYIVVGQSTVGRRHALIEYRDYGFWLIDQGSVNGTFLNGERITGEVRLKHGDRIRLHRAEFEFQLPEMDDGGKTVFVGSDTAAKTLLMEAGELPEPLSPEEARLEEELLAPAGEPPPFSEGDTFVREEPMEPSFHEEETDVREETAEPLSAREPDDGAREGSPTPERETGPAGEVATAEDEDFDMEGFMNSDQFDTPLGGLDLGASEDVTDLPPAQATRQADEDEDRTLAPGYTGEEPDPLDSFISTTILEGDPSTDRSSPEEEEEETEIHPDLRGKEDD